VNVEYGYGVIAPLIIYSDQTSLSKHGKVSGHPIYLLLATKACKQRYLPKGHCLLAILPNFSTQNLSSVQKLQAFQSCLDHVLKPLKKASFK